MKIGKIENNIPVQATSYRQQYFWDMKVGQSVLIKMDKGETIKYLMGHVSSYISAIKAGKYKSLRGRVFTQRKIRNGRKAIGVRVWRIK